MIKWGVLGKEVDVHSKRLAEYLTSAGVANEVVAISLGDFEFGSHQPSGLPISMPLPADIKYLRFAFRRGDQILPHLSNITQDCRELQYCDGVIVNGKEAWPRVALGTAMTKTFSKSSFVDTTKSVLIVGARGRARTAASAAVTLGFKHVVFVSTSEEAMNASVEIMKRTHFATKFETISSDKLIEVASAYSVCVFANDEPLTDSFRTELSFFNFVTPTGVVIDVTDEMANPVMGKAAKEANVRVVTADIPLSYLDSTWVEWIFHHKLDLTKYREFSAGTSLVTCADFQSEDQ